MLAGALTHHEGALRASLRAVYGITDVRNPGCSLTELADYAAHLPAGCPLWLAIGGPAAWSSEVHALMAVEFRLRVLAWQKTDDGRRGINAPQPEEPPRYAHEVAAEEARTLNRVEKYLAQTRR